MFENNIKSYHVSLLSFLNGHKTQDLMYSLGLKLYVITPVSCHYQIQHAEREMV